MHNNTKINVLFLFEYEETFHLLMSMKNINKSMYKSETEHKKNKKMRNTKLEGKETTFSFFNLCV
jgi:hypothetical protein